jgi:hypothetical protein
VSDRCTERTRSGYGRHVTGWQGNEGGWNPQQDPYGQQHGADPYGGQQYGGQPQYGQPQDPYGGAYGQQQYGSDPYAQQYGMPYQGFAPPPPEKKSKLPVVFSIVAIVAIVGAVVTIVLLNRGDDANPSAGPAGSSSAVKPPSSSSRPPSTSRRPPSSSRRPDTKDGWTAISGTGLDYQVPPGWKTATEDRESGITGVTFKGGAEAGPYDCGGDHYFRGFTATGDVQSKTGDALDLNKTITDFANGFAGHYYRSPKIEVGSPASKTVDGHKAAALTAKLTVTPTRPGCEATTGEVAIVGVLVEESGKPAGVRMLVVVNDLAGGPADPPGLPDPMAEEILDTVTVT